MTMTYPQSSYRVRPPKADGPRFQGDIEIFAFPAGTLQPGEEATGETLRRRPGVMVTQAHNLETDHVLETVAKLLAGEYVVPNIDPVTMAVGSGTTRVTSSQTGLDSELLRKPVTVIRTGTKVLFKITLAEGEALGTIGCLGLVGDATGSGAAATGSLTVSGTPAVGDSITVTLGGKGFPTFWVPDADVIVTAAALRDWLNDDGDFSALYTATASGAVVSISSIGAGTVYNGVLGSRVTGAVLCAASGMAGGSTPGGQLLAAANTYFKKERNIQLLIEWTVSVQN